jgi:hypothetical protein
MSKNVFQCIAEVQAALAKDGISKDRKNTAQGYNFRGIDDVYNALSVLLAQTGLVILPSYPERNVIERETSKGGALFYTTVKGEYQLTSAHDCSSVSAGPFWGEAMDTGDKATNKAMSAAYKYMAMQVFAIPTEGDNDADATTHEVKAGVITARGGARERLSPGSIEQIDSLASRILDQFEVNGEQEAYKAYLEARPKLRGDADAQAAFWDRFSSKQRSALKKMLEADRAKELVASQA